LRWRKSENKKAPLLSQSALKITVEFHCFSFPIWETSPFPAVPSIPVLAGIPAACPVLILAGFRANSSREISFLNLARFQDFCQILKTLSRFLNQESRVCSEPQVKLTLYQFSPVKDIKNYSAYQTHNHNRSDKGTELNFITRW
jgi:hypothetical protein